MTRSLLLAVIGCACGGTLAATASAQSKAPLRPFRDDTPVMRAIPVRPPSPVPSDATDDPTGTPSHKVATPIPIRRAQPARPAATPTPPPSTPAPEPAEPGEIRMTPQAGAKSPDQAQIEAADSYYGRKMYDLAAPEYQRYIEQFSNGADLQAAYFRLAESYRKTGSTNAARNTYLDLLARFN